MASFPGSSDYAATQSAPVTFIIGQGSPTIVLTTSGGSAVFGQAVTLVATMTVPGGGPLAGSVTFSDGGTTLGTVTLGGTDTATLTTSTLAIGAQSITAAYSGDADFLGVQSGATSESVAQAGTQMVLMSQPVFRKKKVVSVGLNAEVEPASLDRSGGDQLWLSFRGYRKAEASGCSTCVGHKASCRQKANSG